MNTVFAPVDHASDVPLNDQVITSITQAIRDRRLRPGAKLPKAAELATAMNVNYSTIYVALRKLTSAGVVERCDGPHGGLSVSLDQRSY